MSSGLGFRDGGGAIHWAWAWYLARPSSVVAQGSAALVAVQPFSNVCATSLANAKIIIILEGLSLLHSIPPTTANAKTTNNKMSGEAVRSADGLFTSWHFETSNPAAHFS